MAGLIEMEEKHDHQTDIVRAALLNTLIDCVVRHKIEKHLWALEGLRLMVDTLADDYSESSIKTFTEVILSTRAKALSGGESK